jgi:hypothetical protein
LAQLVKSGQVVALEAMQLLVRASMPNCKEPASTKWIPEVVPQMRFLVIKDKVKLTQYMLHAKHGSLPARVNNLKQILGDSFDDMVKKAKNCET